MGPNFAPTYMYTLVKNGPKIIFDSSTPSDRSRSKLSDWTIGIQVMAIRRSWYKYNVSRTPNALK